MSSSTYRPVQIQGHYDNPDTSGRLYINPTLYDPHTSSYEPFYVRQSGPDGFGDPRSMPLAVSLAASSSTFRPEMRNAGQNSFADMGPCPRTLQDHSLPRNRSQRQTQIPPVQRCFSQTGSQSTCCSSCPDGEVCARPDCSVLHEPINNEADIIPAMSYQEPMQAQQSTHYDSTALPGQSSLELSNIGARFPNSYTDSAMTPPTTFENNFMDNYPGNCPWTQCGEQLHNWEEYSEHLNRQHIEPQLVIPCPVPGDECEGNIGEGVVQHLQSDHPWIFQNEGDGFACPSQMCFPNQIFHNVSMLGAHVDQVHVAAAPLHCNYQDCHSSFQERNDFLEHLNVQHAVPAPSSREDDITLPEKQPNLPTPESMQSLVITGEETSADVPLCRWITGPDRTIVDKFSTTPNNYKSIFQRNTSGH
ncbi:hypothetical protein G7Y89_g630 [Cudoniella acicularis]|uniref:C2H2-type domain-containing protein n=1 Tax=Cudoniella acicularis TaxID=354080 RepID=A0A8H4WB05_9HELO|nr:hypothetical protein G7Y89_g630 [Cudoniella acicularis]